MFQFADFKECKFRWSILKIFPYKNYKILLKSAVLPRNLRDPEISIFREEGEDTLTYREYFYSLELMRRTLDYYLQAFPV